MHNCFIAQSIHGYGFTFRIVKLTSPTLNYFIIVGSLFMYASVYSGVTQTTDKKDVLVQCTVSIPAYFEPRVVKEHL